MKSNRKAIEGRSSAPCSPSLARKYVNRGGEIWEWDGQKWRELFSSDAIQRLDHYEQKIASLDADLRVTYGAVRCAVIRLDEHADGYAETRETIANLAAILPENATVMARPDGGPNT